MQIERTNQGDTSLLRIFHQTRNVEPHTSTDVVCRSHQAMRVYQKGIIADCVPYTQLTSKNLRKLARLKLETLAIIHGSSFSRTAPGRWAASTRRSRNSLAKKKAPNL